MGIRSIDNTEADASLSTFSEHILKVEICGPEVRIPQQKPTLIY
jgi:hypothetical protein